MSGLNALISGADCGPSNALSSVVKHAEVDRSLQRDRVGGPSSSQLRHLPSTSSRGPSEADQVFARQFFENNAGAALSGPPGTSVAPFPAAMLEDQRVAMSRMGSPPLRFGTPQQDSLDQFWSAHGSPMTDLNKSPPPLTLERSPDPQFWSADFSAGSSKATHFEGATQLGSPNMSTYSPYMPQMGVGLGMGMGMASMYSPQLYQAPFAAQPAVTQQPDWDAEFSKLSAGDVKGKGKARFVEVSDDAGFEEAFKQLDVKEKDESEGNVDDYMASFEKVWEEVKATNTGLKDEELSRLEADYRQTLQQGHELDSMEPDYLKEMNENWNNGYGLDMDGLDSDFGLNKLNSQVPQYDEFGAPKLEAYLFNSENQFLAQPSGGLLDSAKKIMTENGSLEEAALLCEAAIQKGELGEGGYEAWILLGQARSMDEREGQALKALREGTRIAQENGNFQAGLLDLAIAYVNESYDLAAHHCLRTWLKARYPDLMPPDASATHYNTVWSSHELTSEAFLSVARALHARGENDPDVQASLGVLVYANGEYDKAKDCFESALQVRPDDYQLWNRLGSCLSNGAKPEEALGAYREALRLRPTYTRAIYNVGVACLNIGALKEAAEHFLSALTLRRPDQDGPGGSSLDGNLDRASDQIWQTLTRTFSAMNRDDLVDLAKFGEVQAFRKDFDF